MLIERLLAVIGQTIFGGKKFMKESWKCPHCYYHSVCPHYGEMTEACKRGVSISMVNLMKKQASKIYVKP